MTKRILLLALCACCIAMSFIPADNATQRLEEIAREYKTYRQHTQNHTVITDSSRGIYNWTVTLCRRPRPTELWHLKHDSAFISQADAGKSPHGNKLYKLYVKDYGSYFWHRERPQPVGQVIVKETWNVRRIVFNRDDTITQQIFNDNDSNWYAPTTPSELFIMYKEEKNKGNDRGWNYGTVSLEHPDEKPMLLNGIKMSTCIRCHRENKYDRLLGTGN